MSEYRVQLDVFSGPLDLLLYLVRRDELDVQDVQVSRVAEQYLEYVKLLEQIDPSAAGEFLVMTATLVELKSRALLPAPPPAGDDDDDDPQRNLVRQLLEYKAFKDAARTLCGAAEQRAARFSRAPAELPEELRGVELESVEIWDLLEAYGRVMTAIGRGPGFHEVTYDERPIEWYAEAVLTALQRRSPLTFEDVFEGRATRADVVGLFLALLELIRTRRIQVEQDRLFGTIYLFRGSERAAPEGDAPALTTLAQDAGEAAQEPSSTPPDPRSHPRRATRRVRSNLRKPPARPARPLDSRTRDSPNLS
jgi:segregation and condensation protein A